MLDWITAHGSDILTIVTSVISVASVVAALTPTQADDNVVSILKKIADFFALNVLHAKNPPTDPTTPAS